MVHCSVAAPTHGGWRGPGLDCSQQPRCTTRHQVQAPGCPVFLLGLEAPGWMEGPPGCRCPVLCSCPRPQAPAEAKAQAGRRYLGLRQGLTLPGWFFAGIARGEGKGK